MSNEQTAQRTDKVLALQAMEEAELYKLLGSESRSASVGAAPDDRDEAEVGRNFFQRQQTTLRKLVCHSETIRKLTENTADFNMKELVPVLLDLVASVVGVLPGATATALLLKMGIHSLCEAEWRN